MIYWNLSFTPKGLERIHAYSTPKMFMPLLQEWHALPGRSFIIVTGRGSYQGEVGGYLSPLVACTDLLIYVRYLGGWEGRSFTSVLVWFVHVLGCVLSSAVGSYQKQTVQNSQRISIYIYIFFFGKSTLAESLALLLRWFLDHQTWS